eukprot:GHVN01041828.1.p1 GENE.GHVN01041828.1~~GHVN01041828.1.p1  ORF type:complete len:422 (+),score=52.06 GHVN01041828.1:181-1446(+)
MSVPGYHQVASHEARKGEFNRCVLLYSGGLDTSVMLKWIQEEYHCEIVALTIDIGQTADDLEAIKQKALKLGAKEAIVVDCKEQFANWLIKEAIWANADYQGGYALGCPLGRVIIARAAVEAAAKHDCQVVAHGCTGKGNDQVRFEGYITTLNPNLKTIAPVREWGMGRDEEIEYAVKHNIEVKQKKDKPYSYDENMWSNTAEGGEIEDPSLIPPLKDILLWAQTPENALETRGTLKLTFSKGVPVAIDGKKMNLVEMISHLNILGGSHGCGVFPLIEDRIVGLKVRGIYENPAATILIAAHKKLEYLVSTREENELKNFIDQKWSYLVYGAKYFDPAMEHIRAYLLSSNKKCSGEVTVQLYKGNVDVVALNSPYSLFDSSLATFNKCPAFNQNASPGFIELWNMAQKTAFNISKQVYGHE